MLVTVEILIFPFVAAFVDADDGRALASVRSSDCEADLVLCNRVKFGSGECLAGM
jgi:hypothetical protein